YLFLHGGTAHIRWNMFVLFMLGPILEQVVGAKRFLNSYLITGLGALALQFAVQALEIYMIVDSFSAQAFLSEIDVANRSARVLSSLPVDARQTLLSIYTTPMVGASGAIYGLLIAFGYLFPNTPLRLIFLPVPIK